MAKLPALTAATAAAATEDPVAALIARVAQGDRAAFRDLYAAAAPKLFGVVLRMLGDRGEAEDVIQDTFTRAWTGAARFDPAKGRGMTWLIAIARNRAIDRLRARPDRPAAEAEELEALADPAPGAEAGGSPAGRPRPARGLHEAARPRPRGGGAGGLPAGA